MTDEQIAVMLNTMKTTLDRIDHELLGNGQPGRVAKIETRLTDIEQFEFQAKGVIAGLGVVITAVGAFVAKHIFGK